MHVFVASFVCASLCTVQVNKMLNGNIYEFSLEQLNMLSVFFLFFFLCVCSKMYSHSVGICSFNALTAFVYGMFTCTHVGWRARQFNYYYHDE